LYAAGTYVLAAYRDKGVAKKLWVHALKRYRPKYVEVFVASRGGSKLIASLQKKFKNITWSVIK